MYLIRKNILSLCYYKSKGQDLSKMRGFPICFWSNEIQIKQNISPAQMGFKKRIQGLLYLKIGQVLIEILAIDSVFTLSGMNGPHNY